MRKSKKIEMVSPVVRLKYSAQCLLVSIFTGQIHKTHLFAAGMVRALLAM